MQSKSRPPRILIVEDEALIAALVQDMLEELGYESLGPASTLEAALAAVADVKLDAAILDLNLNGQQAYPVAEALRQREIPFVFTTGYDGGEKLDEWKEIRRVQKPFTANQLGSALEAIL